MGGVFMKKIIIISICFFFLASGLYARDVWQDKKVLQQNLIRLHVVANSNLQQDQEIKLLVKDAVVSYLQTLVADVLNKEQAMALVKTNILSIQNVANDMLAKVGEDDRAVVSIGKEVFDTRNYDTFSLPAGVYDSLRIEIGNGQGKNWWCVVFPTLCLPATSDGFQETAVSSGFTKELSNSLANGRNFRFYVLDFLGNVEKLFY